ncbi:hypothetical protein A2454_01570 [Candidatus Peribacteria bacterium RIFOXYC2_FULL_55_14]|nr:MAG: hypothetical protein UY87_C0043G0006 [Candidatus Peribacteria bacterium GW2011_GWC2_54_8]OGJ72866.1 MAG: hypothetical protein A2198_00685 [Candidatus Peribacteria bacterium RIFOXYA1_FULL_56_14]OGJ73413.1 MAG: hypothetical protein A2217_01750 [Candidatus Peribacteria bacterium RIFOXYA2_FULL_55_28]OGJ74595.1 MAG: hypothetical protein A2384_03040 [Candidatus Peribacteria bacterium RIFOXYB1_FULL_54_35]OGJ77641.1 MAG: hypothetical protein A2327_05390 [Candidatus Peribacteria bacterium RIFOXY
MIDQPFSLFAPYADRICVALFTKEDAILSDTDAAKHLGLQKAAGLHQVHGGKTVVVQEAHNRTIQADGMLTDTRELLLAVRWADCQNFVMYAPAAHVAGVLHVGWRGLLASAIPAFFSVLQKKWGIPASEVLVGAGPSLCLACAEYANPGHELRKRVSSAYGRNCCIDLQRMAEDQLKSCGVLPKHTERHSDCTRCHRETYWTYRGGHREQVLAGKTNMLCCALLQEK